MKKTPWFEGWQKPVREGVYQTRINAVGWSYWTGHGWGAQMYSREDAFKHRQIVGVDWKQWRGLVSPSSLRVPAASPADTPPASRIARRTAAGGGTL